MAEVEEGPSRYNPHTKTRPGRLALFQVGVGNLVPLLGVIFLRWDPGCVVFIYWAENVLEGLFGWKRIRRFREGSPEIPEEVLKAPLTYAQVTFVHGVFAFFVLFGLRHYVPGDELAEGVEVAVAPGATLYFWVAVLALAVFRLLAHSREAQPKEEESVALAISTADRMGSRMTIMHLTVFFGMLGTLFFGHLSVLVVVFVVVKAAIDLVLLQIPPRRALEED